MLISSFIELSEETSKPSTVNSRDIYWCSFFITGIETNFLEVNNVLGRRIQSTGMDGLEDYCLESTSE